MMTFRNNEERINTKNISLDKLVPQNHIIRKIDNALDLSFIYEKVQHLYSGTRKPNIDPVVLFKIIIIQYIFGIRSMHQTIKEIEVNIAYRWYLGYGFKEKIPHFSTFGKNYKRRFQGTDIFNEIFFCIIDEITKCKFLDAENIFIDGTYIKANANLKKIRNIVIEESSKFYQEVLNEEIKKDREFHKKSLNLKKKLKLKI